MALDSLRAGLRNRTLHQSHHNDTAPAVERLLQAPKSPQAVNCMRPAPSREANVIPGLLTNAARRAPIHGNVLSKRRTAPKSLESSATGVPLCQLDTRVSTEARSLAMRERCTVCTRTSARQAERQIFHSWTVLAPGRSRGQDAPDFSVCGTHPTLRALALAPRSQLSALSG